MKEGLLWYDTITKTRDLRGCIARAVAAYRRKHGEMPTTCVVHEGAQGDVVKVGTVRVIGLPTVLKGYYWVGMDKTKGEQ